MSPTSTFLSMTVPSMGERMVAQSSVAWTSLTVSWARRESASADCSAVAAFSYSCRLTALDLTAVGHSVSPQRPPGRGPLRWTPPLPWPAVAWPSNPCHPVAARRPRLRTFWPALRLTSTTRAKQFRANRRLMHGADRAHRGFVKRQSHQTHRLHVALERPMTGTGRSWPSPAPSARTCRRARA